tara:strand:- start:1219 stop:2070 length:852 start_codon:yes stop_codon:yes gene_type:complete
MFAETVKHININYETNNNKVSFDLKFGKGKDSNIEKNEKKRTNYSEQYNIEIYESEENKGYRILCDDSPLIVDISNININGNNNNDYAIGFAVDSNEPLYNNEESIIPYNIERDGTMWSLPGNENNNYKFDQNPNGEYQWHTKKACAVGYKTTDEEKELGLEETSEKTGIIYITFMLMYKEKEIYQSKSFRSGVTRGTTRGSSLRGGDELQNDSVAGRFGYGNAATTSSVKSNYKYLPQTERYILPIRVRINSDSEDTDINCSESLKGANVNDLKKKTMVVPF